jgi:hypothetical protein
MTNYVGLDVSQKTTTLCIIVEKDIDNGEVSALPRLSILRRQLLLARKVDGRH